MQEFGLQQSCVMCQSVGMSGIVNACVLYRLTFMLLKFYMGTSVYIVIC